jgi:hypothetical protein
MARPTAGDAGPDPRTIGNRNAEAVIVPKWFLIKRLSLEAGAGAGGQGLHPARPALQNAHTRDRQHQPGTLDRIRNRKQAGL